VRISGSYDPFAGPRSRWGLGKYEIALKAENLEGDIAKIIRGRANADLTLRGDPEAEPMDKISGAVRIANAKVTIPRKAITGGFSWRPRFSPQMDIAVIAGDMHVETATAQVILAGKGKIGGHLGYEPMALDMKLGAKKGKLDFPAAAAEIKTLDVTASKQPEQPLNVFGHIEAQARVGRYRMDLSGGGALFPASNLAIHTTSTPPLTDAQAMALLLGVPPSTLGSAGLPPEEALGVEVANRLASPVAALAATGVSAPLLRAIGLDELTLGMASIAVGKRLAKTIYLYYVSPTGGAANATSAGSATATGLTRVIIDVTPQASIGFSVNDLQQWRYEIQSIRLF
jgi:spore maturation protein SpmB